MNDGSAAIFGPSDVASSAPVLDLLARCANLAAFRLAFCRLPVFGRVMMSSIDRLMRFPRVVSSRKSPQLPLCYSPAKQRGPCRCVTSHRPAKDIILESILAVPICEGDIACLETRNSVADHVAKFGSQVTLNFRDLHAAIRYLSRGFL